MQEKLYFCFWTVDTHDTNMEKRAFLGMQTNSLWFVLVLINIAVQKKITALEEALEFQMSLHGTIFSFLGGWSEIERNMTQINTKNQESRFSYQDWGKLMISKSIKTDLCPFDT